MKRAVKQTHKRAGVAKQGAAQRHGSVKQDASLNAKDKKTDAMQWLIRKAAPTAAAMAIMLSPAVDGNQALAGLPSLNPIKDGRVLLRNSLPIDNKNSIRVVQKNLESVSEALRVPGVKFSDVDKAVKRSQKVVTSTQKRNEILNAVPAGQKRDAAAATLKDIQSDLQDFDAIVQNKDKQEVPIIQQKILEKVGDIEADMVEKFPYEIPAEYSSLPQLKGRATFEMKLKLKDAKERSLDFDRCTLKIVVDGYNAPLTSGNFVDLVERKFYDNMDIQRSDGFVVQTGDPSGPSEGFIDPSTGEVRRIPFEVMVQGDKSPVYEETLEDLGRFNEQPVLPFNAFGTIAMARSEFEPNSASSQFFFLLRDSELTPTGSNLLDGRYAVFGYVTEGKDFLENVKVGDTIESIKLLDGAENLVRKQAPPPITETPVADTAVADTAN